MPEPFAIPLNGAVDKATADQMTRPQEPGAELIGNAGRPLYRGRGRYEINYDYVDRGWWDETVPRLQTHPVVDTAWSLRLGMMQSALVEVGGDDPDPAASEWLRLQCGIEDRPAQMEETWESLLERLSRAIPVGAVCCEYVTHVGPGGLRYVTLFHDRPMSSVVAVASHQERFAGVLYRCVDPLTGATQDKPIPASQCLLLSYRKRGPCDWDGQGIWRCIAPEANDYRETTQSLRAGGRSYAVGRLQVRIDVDLADRCGAIGAKSKEEWLTAERTAADAWVEAVEDGDADASSFPAWWDPHFAGAEGYDPVKLVAQRTTYAETIHQRHGTEYVMVGGTQAAGSYDAARVKVEGLALAAQNDLDWLLAELMRQVFNRLIEVNFQGLPPARYPRLVASGLSAPLWVEKMGEFVQLQQNATIQTTAEDERYMRKVLRFRQRAAAEAVQSRANVQIDTSSADAARSGQRGKAAQ